MRVTWADTDAAQVVHYSKYFVFFERAEQEFYRSIGLSFIELRKQGFWFPRVEACCEYKKPAIFDDLLEVELEIDELKDKSVKYVFRVINKKSSDLLAIGHVVVVAVDKQSGQTTQIPKDIAERLKPYQKQIL